MSERIDYVELPGRDLAASQSFYTSAFGWSFVDPAGNELGVWGV